MITVVFAVDWENAEMQSKNTVYIERLDHLWFFAALIVLLFKTNLQYLAHTGERDRTILPMFEQGYTGVGLFMVISGFILTLISLERKIDVPKFYLNRVLRIYPLFIFIITFGYFVTQGPRDTSIGIDYLLALLPISNLYRTNYGPYGGMLWSVAVELQFYLLFPLLILALRQGPQVLIGIIGFFITLRCGVYLIDGTVHQLAYSSIFGAIDFFLIGCLTSVVYQRAQNTEYDRLPGYWWVLVFVGANLLIYAMHHQGGLFHVDYANTSPSHVSYSAWWIVWPTI